MNALRIPSPFDCTIADRDGFPVLDECHRHTLRLLDELAALVETLRHEGPTPEARACATRIAAFFSTTAREHHEDEERRVFPALLRSGQPDLTRAVLRLQSDHDGLEEDWFDIAPHVLAVARGSPSYDLEALRDGVAALASLYREHIRLEEACVYRRAAR